MNDIVVSLLSGGFAGAAVVIALSKLLIESRLKQATQRHQHELDVKKDALQTDLALYAHQQNTKYSKHEESRRIAIEKAYHAVVSTSFTRAGFKKYNNLTDLPQEQYCSAYFSACSETFTSFSNMFKKITEAYAILDDHAIYLDEDTEKLIINTLKTILQHYQNRHDWIIEAHKDSQLLFKENKLTSETASINFDNFYSTSLQTWLSLTNDARRELKKSIRILLNPKP